MRPTGTKAVAFAILVSLNQVGKGESCRWALYASTYHEINADVLMTNSTNALAFQSYGTPLLHWIEEGKFFERDMLYVRNHAENRDGFGLGWFDEDGRIKRERSAKSITDRLTNEIDPDAMDLARAVRSKVMFAHVRAATEGAPNELNSHPFVFNKILWMHNGGYSEKDALLQLLQSRCVNVKRTVYGLTDSEYAGALVNDHLAKEFGKDNFTLEELRDAFLAALRDLNMLSTDSDSHSSLNFALSDGKHILATRYRTAPNEDPPSLYFSLGGLWREEFEALDPVEHSGILDLPYYEMYGESVLVASEPISASNFSTWVPLVKDQMIMFDVERKRLQLQCLSESCREDLEHRCEVASFEKLRNFFCAQVGNRKQQHIVTQGKQENESCIGSKERPPSS